MSNTLLPCPFCGREATVGTIPISGGGYVYAFVECLSETCNGSSGQHDTEAEAIAAWNSRVDARQLALKTRVCPMCEDCPDGCPVETPKDSRNIVTNADRIRSMSDEELAMWLVGATVCERVCDEDEYCHGNECIKRVTDWLQQPAKEDV